MKISEISKYCGLSISTIRYYEKLGLCPFIDRGSDGVRRFSRRDADWLALLASLRATGMPLAEMKAFAALYLAGNDTVPARKAALLAHERRLNARQAELDRCRAVLAQKVQRYDEIMGES